MKGVTGSSSVATRRARIAGVNRGLKPTATIIGSLRDNLEMERYAQKADGMLGGSVMLNCCLMSFTAIVDLHACVRKKRSQPRNEQRQHYAASCSQQKHQAKRNRDGEEHPQVSPSSPLSNPI